MTVVASGLITVQNICDEGDWYSDGVLYPTSSRAAFDRMADYSCINLPLSNLGLDSWYGYVHPIIEITGISFVSQSFTRITYNVTITATTDNASRDKAINLRVRETLNAGATSFSTIAGTTTKPTLVDPDSITFGTGSFPTATSTTLVFPVGVSSISFAVTVPKVAATYVLDFDLIRTKGDANDDRYKISSTVNAPSPPLGSPSGIQRESITVPAAPQLYNWESTNEGTITADPCNASFLLDTVYMFKGGDVTSGDPVVGDQAFSNNDLDNLIPFANGRYAFERNTERFNVFIRDGNGTIDTISACP